MIFSVDYEEWYHLLGFNKSFNTDWDSYEEFLPRITPQLLDFLDEQNIKAIFFVLGYVAQKNPELIKEIDNRGHIIGSHGYNHDFIFDLTKEQFEDDLRLSKTILREITGKDPLWYRAPGFSVTNRSPWFYEVLANLNFRYDSSYSQVQRSYGSNLFVKSEMAGGQIESFPLNGSHIVQTVCGEISVIPVACDQSRTILFGGGYFRIIPFYLLKTVFKRRLDEGFFYIHPRDIFIHDDESLKLSLIHTLRSNFGRRRGINKLKRIIEYFEFIDPNEIHSKS